MPFPLGSFVNTSSPILIGNLIMARSRQKDRAEFRFATSTARNFVPFTPLNPSRFTALNFVPHGAAHIAAAGHALPDPSANSRKFPRLILQSWHSAGGRRALGSSSPDRLLRSVGWRICQRWCHITNLVFSDDATH